ncbi:MAG: phenylalanine--tRNA ligase subunit alpha [Nanoarchaeota archaeon]
MTQNNEKILETLSPNERKILPYIGEEIANICKKSNLDKVSVTRALGYLENKELVKLETIKKRIIELGVNGALYKKKGLPERRLINLLYEKKIISIEEAQKQSKLSDDEFKASIGALKKRALIDLQKNKLIFNSKKEEITKKSLEEFFLESLPLNYDNLTAEQKYAFESLQKRKKIIEIREEKEIIAIPTKTGEELSRKNLEKKDLIEQVNSDMLAKGSWKGKKFRKYDVISGVPQIYGGKRHFVNQAVDYAKKIWTEMGFEEMSGNLIQTSFWNFDALFTAQDHSVREMQDTFFLNKDEELPDKKIVKAVKEAHEKGVDGSKGWGGTWNEEEAKKLVLRTHTTCLSAATLANIDKKDLPKKFFAIGKVFRNETLDINHLFELTQTEGIVIDKNANLRHLIGYIKEFYRKMGYEQIRIRPSYFPYTEPSLEIDVFDKNQKKWIELGGAGIFRPEVVIPLMGENIPVLAWGQGFERIIREYFEIADIRDMYKNDLNKLRKMKFWMK